MPLKQEVIEVLDGQWSVGMFEAPMKNPMQCLFGSCCPCCAVYKQREELLELTGEPYVCCAGLCDCCGLGDPQDKNCLYVEACCCTSWALAGNRFMVQTRFNKENTPCDDCILWTVCLLDLAICIASMFTKVPEEIKLLADMIQCSVFGCMHAQQQIEIEEIRKKGYIGMKPTILQVLPPPMQNMYAKGPYGQGAQVQQPPQVVGMSHA